MHIPCPIVHQYWLCRDIIISHTISAAKCHLPNLSPFITKSAAILKDIYRLTRVKRMNLNNFKILTHAFWVKFKKLAIFIQLLDNLLLKNRGLALKPWIPLSWWFNIGPTYLGDSTMGKMNRSCLEWEMLQKTEIVYRVYACGRKTWPFLSRKTS